jgi:phosphoglucosamine mutase
MTLFGTSGIRRRLDRDLLELSFKAGLAMGRRYHRVVIAGDTRTSSPAVKYACVAGLLASGAEVHDAGTAPTPTVALAGRRFDAAMMITASHNPPEYNGIKILNPDGSSFSPEQQMELEQDIINASIPAVGWDSFRSDEKYPDAAAQHIAHIRSFFPAQYGAKVVLDCAGRRPRSSARRFWSRWAAGDTAQRQSHPLFPSSGGTNSRKPE